MIKTNKNIVLYFKKYLKDNYTYEILEKELIKQGYNKKQIKKSYTSYLLEYSSNRTYSIFLTILKYNYLTLFLSIIVYMLYYIDFFIEDLLFTNIFLVAISLILILYFDIKILKSSLNSHKNTFIKYVYYILTSIYTLFNLCFYFIVFSIIEARGMNLQEVLMYEQMFFVFVKISFIVALIFLMLNRLQIGIKKSFTKNKYNLIILSLIIFLILNLILIEFVEVPNLIDSSKMEYDVKYVSFNNINPRIINNNLIITEYKGDVFNLYINSDLVYSGDLEIIPEVLENGTPLIFRIYSIKTTENKGIFYSSNFSNIKNWKLISDAYYTSSIQIIDNEIMYNEILNSGKRNLFSKNKTYGEQYDSVILLKNINNKLVYVGISNFSQNCSNDSKKVLVYDDENYSSFFSEIRYPFLINNKIAYVVSNTIENTNYCTYNNYYITNNDNEVLSNKYDLIYPLSLNGGLKFYASINNSKFLFYDNNEHKLEEETELVMYTTIDNDLYYILKKGSGSYEGYENRPRFYFYKNDKLIKEIEYFAEYSNSQIRKDFTTFSDLSIFQKILFIKSQPIYIEKLERFNQKIDTTISINYGDKKIDTKFNSCSIGNINNKLLIFCKKRGLPFLVGSYTIFDRYYIIQEK